MTGINLQHLNITCVG